MYWTKGDAVSRGLLRLAAGEGWGGAPVTAGVAELANRHGLISALARECDDPVVNAMSAREGIRSRTLRSHLPRLLGSLQAAGVRTTVVKGPSVSALYSRPELRNYSDLDLLVPREQLSEAIAVLSADEGVLEVPPKGPKSDKRDLLFSDPSGVVFNVDLHWSLFSYSQLRGTADEATPEAWDGATFEQTPLGPQWVLPLPHRLAFLAAHAILDHRFRLILFRDFVEIAEGDIDWDELVDVAARHGLRSTTYISLWIARLALGARIPDESLAAIRLRSAPVTYLEKTLPKVDLVRFDGHRPHPINLAAVLLNDSRKRRMALLARGPGAVPGWRKRVLSEGAATTSPRTLVVVTNDRRRGAEVTAERLRDGLVRQGWVIEAVGLYDTSASPRASVETLVEARGREGSRFDLRVVSALRRKIKSFRPDVVVANGGPTLRYTVAVKLFSPFKLVYVGIGDPSYWIRSRSSLLINRFLLRRTDHVLAVSDTTKDQLLEIEPSLEGRVDTALFGAPARLLQNPRSGSTGPLRLLVLGSLTEEKNPVLALRAAAAVDGVLVRFVGTGPLEEALEREAATLGISKRVELVGSVVDVGEHLSWAHLLLLTSRTEGLPGAILEAAAAGVPTVALDVGGVREAVQDGVTGLVVDDPADLVAAISVLDADRSRIESMSSAGRELIRSTYTVEHAVERYRGLLLSIWGDSIPRDG